MVTIDLFIIIPLSISLRRRLLPIATEFRNDIYVTVHRQTSMISGTDPAKGPESTSETRPNPDLVWGRRCSPAEAAEEQLTEAEL